MIRRKPYLALELRRLRKAQHFTQRIAAIRSGIGEETISTFETGDRVASIRLVDLIRLLRAYGCGAERIGEIVRDVVVDAAR